METNIKNLSEKIAKINPNVTISKMKEDPEKKFEYQLPKGFVQLEFLKKTARFFSKQEDPNAQELKENLAQIRAKMQSSDADLAMDESRPTMSPR